MRINYKYLIRDADNELILFEVYYKHDWVNSDEKCYYKHDWVNSNEKC